MRTRKGISGFFAVGGTGLELFAKTSEKSHYLKESGAESDAHDADLTALVAAWPLWPLLPGPIKAAVRALVASVNAG